MTTEVDVTRWSLPGRAKVPRDALRMQLEIYGETILMRGFEGDYHVGEDGLGRRDRKRADPAPGVLLGAPAGGVHLVVPGRDRPLGGPVETPAGLARGPATGGVQAPRTAQGTHARAGLRLLAEPCALGLRRKGSAHRPRADPLPGPRLQRLLRRTGLPRKPQVPGGDRADTRVLLPVLLLAYGRHPGPLQETPLKPASAMGGARWTD